jgi:PAS domain-containing protein
MSNTEFSCLTGVIRHVHVVAHAGRDNSGNLEYVGVVTDITERKRADEERETLSRSLQESKARLEEAQSVAHVGYWDWVLETGEIIGSDETYRIFGFKPQERRMDIEAVTRITYGRKTNTRETPGEFLPPTFKAASPFCFC